MTTQLVILVLMTALISFACGGFACYDYAFERGRKRGHHEAHAWSKKWSDVGQ